MTKTKALKVMNEYSRNIIDTQLASKIAQVFDCKLTTLGVKGKKVSELIDIYPDELKDVSGVSVCELAKELVRYKKGVIVQSHMIGRGSYAQDITEKAIKILKEIK